MVYIPIFTIKIKHSCGVNIPYMDRTPILVNRHVGPLMNKGHGPNACPVHLLTWLLLKHRKHLRVSLWLGGPGFFRFKQLGVQRRCFWRLGVRAGLCRREHRNLQAGLQTLYHSMHLDVRIHLTAMRLTTEVTPRISLLATDFKQVLAQQNMKS